MAGTIGFDGVMDAASAPARRLVTFAAKAALVRIRQASKIRPIKLIALRAEYERSIGTNCAVSSAIYGNSRQCSSLYIGNSGDSLSSTKGKNTEQFLTRVNSDRRFFARIVIMRASRCRSLCGEYHGAVPDSPRQFSHPPQLCSLFRFVPFGRADVRLDAATGGKSGGDGFPFTAFVHSAVDVGRTEPDGDI